MDTVSLAAPLRRPAFRRLALSYTVNELGNWLGEIALAVFVFDQTGSALAVAALFLVARFLPGLAAPAVVARIEVFPARRALPLLYGAEACAMVVLALIAAGGFSLPLVLALAGLDGVLASAARALSRAAIGGLLRPAGELRAGNAVLNIGYTAIAAIGPAAAGLVVAGFGPSTALAGDAVSFGLVAWLLAATSGLPQPQADATPWPTRLRGALRYVRGQALLHRLLWAQAFSTIFLTLVIPVEVVFAKRTLDAGDSGYGALLAAWGVGMAIGSIVYARRLSSSLWPLLLASTIAMGVSYAATAAAPTIAAACAAAVVGGAGNGVQWVAVISTVQELVDASHETRVLGIFEAVASAMPGLGFVLGGALAALFAPRVAYAVAGAGVLGLALLGIPLVGRSWAAAEARA
jgi:MFS family permease